MTTGNRVFPWMELAHLKVYLCNLRHVYVMFVFSRDILDLEKNYS